MLKHTIVALAFFLSAAPAFAQAQLDEVSKQASQLEADLGKMLDTTPQAADIMVQLVDLYHANGRVFGLIRAGQKFASAQPQHKKHRDVMLKLLDGLVIMSRNKEIIATSRQFLTRYPKDKACVGVEETLARTLDQESDRRQSAIAWEAVWRRDPSGQREAGVRAVWQYSSLNNNDGLKAAAALAKDMIDSLPAGEFSNHLGWEGFHFARRTGDWTGSNTIGLLILKKNVPMDAARRADLHRYMAENYTNVGQRTNAVDSLKKARAAKDSDDLHRRLISEMYNAGAKAGEMEPIVTEYMSKYKDRGDRWANLSLLAHVYGRDGDRAHAASLFAQILPHDPAAHDASGHFVSYSGDKSEDFAKVERALLDALSKVDSASDQASSLRYTLAFNLYRDRMKDANKARAMARDLALKSPVNNDRNWYAVHYLLYNPADADSFAGDVKALSDAAVKHANLNYYRDHVSRWTKEAGRSKDHRDNVKIAKDIWDRTSGDAYFKEWELATENQSSKTIAARNRLLAGEHYKRLNDDQARWLLRSQGYYHQHYVSQKERPDSIGYYAKLCARLPKDYEAATWWLQAATDYGTPEQARDAAQHVLKLEGPGNDSDVWRRALIAADRTKDEKLAKQALAYALASQKKFGDDGGNVAEIGSHLDKVGLKAEAIQYWRDHCTLAPWDWQSRSAVGAVVERLEKGPDKLAFLTEVNKTATSFHGAYATWVAHVHYTNGDMAKFASVLAETKKRQAERPLQSWGIEEYPAWTWLQEQRDANNKKATDETRRAVYTALRDLDMGRISAWCALALMELEKPGSQSEVARLVDVQKATTSVGDSSSAWDTLMPFAQATMGRKDYLASAALLTGMLNNISGVDGGRQKAGRDMIGQSYARLGSVGLAIDENSPIAPLLQAAMYLRLGDEKLAFETYLSNRKLFDAHRFELPIDLILFVCESHTAAGGDENYDRVEDILRSWLVKFVDGNQHDDATKAKIQLLLAKNYFNAKRYEVARAEFTSVINRFGKTSEALDAEFGIGETFMAQKLYDEAEKIFEKLSNSRDRDTVVRAEFLRGLLAHRKGDRDTAREIFRSVLERVPNLSLANMTLFNLAEVYGEEQRYIEQLELLNTVGRLGRASKRWHTPGATLSIVVQDSDLGISRGHSRIPVIITTEPGGDEETIYLTSGGAGKGLFRGDLSTQLGAIVKGDKTLQLTGRDVIKCDYPAQFKAEFRTVPLADAEIRIAADGKFDVSSSKIVDEQKETFSQQLVREEMEEEDQDKRQSQQRPKNQIKPGNVIYLRVQDADRDLSDQPDEVLVKLTATSGDQVQVAMVETGPHTGLFEGTIKTGELPAGALASDHAIDHQPLLAIDHDPKSYWQSEPDGQTPKSLSIDMKDLKRVTRVSLSTPDATRQAPIRGEIQGSHDGRFWFRLASNPPAQPAAPVKGEMGRMEVRAYSWRGGATIASWKDIVTLTKTREPIETKAVDELAWQKPTDDESAKNTFAVVFSGKFVQPRDGAVRFNLAGALTAIAVNGVVELDVEKGGRSVDVWLPRGLHDITAFSLLANNAAGAEMTRARESLSAAQVTLAPFHKADFNLESPDAKATGAKPQAAGKPYTLDASSAKLEKKSAEFKVGTQYGEPAIAWWQNEGDIASWEVNIDAPGAYAVWMNWSHQGEGSAYSLTLGDQKINGKVGDTREWSRFVTEQVGTVRIDKAGKYILAIKPTAIAGGGLMDLRSVTLRPTSSSLVVQADGKWEATFDAHEVRYVRFLVHEYSGEAVAISHVEIGGDSGDKPYIPTEADVLALASNDSLEIAAGDIVNASYTDEYTFTLAAGSEEPVRNRVLNAQLQATYFNARILPIAYEFSRTGGGGVGTLRKELMRIDPGERIIIEVVDYDMDQTGERDTIKVQVAVNDGPPIELIATETEAYSGVFTKEVDTRALTPPPANAKSTGAKNAAGADAKGAAPAKTAEQTAAEDAGKLAVKQGDRIYIRYVDPQNTFPGHSVKRESFVYVNQPTDGLVRIVETRMVQPKAQGANATLTYLPPRNTETASFAFEAPLTIEVIDPDRAKDSRSSIEVELTTTDGAKVLVNCAISTAFAAVNAAFAGDDARSWALEEGRFVGQVILQLGGKASPEFVPLTTNMPRTLIGGPVMVDAV
ncbi:MAG: hypothetical protein WD768_08885, partial [Phycisphaeraceae bacterium]